MTKLSCQCIQVRGILFTFQFSIFNMVEASLFLKEACPRIQITWSQHMVRGGYILNLLCRHCLVEYQRILQFSDQVISMF